MGQRPDPSFLLSALQYTVDASQLSASELLSKLFSKPNLDCEKDQQVADPSLFGICKISVSSPARINKVRSQDDKLWTKDVSKTKPPSSKLAKKITNYFQQKAKVPVVAPKSEQTLRSTTKKRGTKQRGKDTLFTLPKRTARQVRNELEVTLKDYEKYRSIQDKACDKCCTICCRVFQLAPLTMCSDVHRNTPACNKSGWYPHVSKRYLKSSHDQSKVGWISPRPGSVANPLAWHKRSSSTPQSKTKGPTPTQGEAKPLEVSKDTNINPKIKDRDIPAPKKVISLMEEDMQSGEPKESNWMLTPSQTSGFDSDQMGGLKRYFANWSGPMPVYATAWSKNLFDQSRMRKRPRTS